MTIYTWGVDFLNYLPKSFQLVWYVIGIIFVLIIPDSFPQIESAFFQYPLGEPKIKIGIHYIRFVGIAALSLIIFFVFRERYHLIGDPLDPHYIFLPTAQMWDRLSDEVIGISEFLAIQFNMVPMHSDPRVGAHLASIFHGGSFVFLALIFARHFGKNFSESLMLFLFLVTGQYVFVFFGHGDNYYTPLVMFLWYFYELFRTMERKQYDYRLILSCFLAIYSHPVGFAFLPSCFLACLFYDSKDSWKRPVVLLLLVVCSGILAYLLLFMTHQSSVLFNVHLFKEVDYKLPFFSFYKISLILNTYLSNAFTGTILFLTALIQIFRTKQFHKESHNSPLWILLTILLPLFFLDIFVDHSLGICDQDLMAISAFTLSMIGLWMYIKYCRFRYSFSMIFLNLWLLIPMVAVFHTNTNVKRLEYLNPLDICYLNNVYSPYARLGANFTYEKGLENEALHQFALGIQNTWGNTRLVNLSYFYYYSYQYGRVKEGKETLAYLLNTFPEQADYIFRFPIDRQSILFQDTQQLSKELYEKTKNPVYLKIQQMLYIK